MSDSLAEELRRILERRARKHVGVAAGVLLGGETAFLAHGRVGPTRPQAPDETTIFEIGSITKVFTATVLAALAENGLVALGDPVDRYLPEGVALPVRGRPITLADLATHTSGLPRLPKGMLRHALRNRANPYARLTASDLERAVVEGRLRSAPGQRFRYSNFGAGLLGHVLALRSQKPYDELVREVVCGPLGLEDTRVDLPTADLPRFADGHDRRGRPVSHWDGPALAGAGALRSTADDLLRFLRAQLEPEATPLAAAIAETHRTRFAAGHRMEQCLGWFALPPRRGHPRVLWHGGGTGGFRSFAGVVPESGAAAVVLSNCARSVDAVGFRMLQVAAREGAVGSRTAR